MKRCSKPVALVVLALLAGAVPCFAQASAVVDQTSFVDQTPLVGPTPLSRPAPFVGRTSVATDRELLHKYIWSRLGLEGALNATVFSGLGQWQDSPPEWATSATGYARRWSSKYAEAAIGDAAKYAVARIFEHDPAFKKCECAGIAGRLRHAIDSPFMARKRDGRRVLSAASLAGFLAGHLVSATTWYPAPNGARDGLTHAGTSLVKAIGIDVLKEFWPRRSK